MKWNKLNCVLKVLDTESDPDAGNLVAQQPFFLIVSQLCCISLKMSLNQNQQKTAKEVQTEQSFCRM